MKIGWSVALAACMLMAEGVASAQSPLAMPGARAVDAVAGNKDIQLRYLGTPPFSSIPSNLDYGFLLTEDREFDFSAAWLFDTDIVPLSRFRLQVGPRADLAWLKTGSKTQVFALSVGAAARYELIPRLGLSVFGSAYYSPGVLTSGPAHNLYDFTAGGEIRLFSRLYALGGYRWFKFTLINQPDEKLSNELFAGVRWQLE
jgi:YfaZ precursor